MDSTPVTAVRVVCTGGCCPPGQLDGHRLSLQGAPVSSHQGPHWAQPEPRPASHCAMGFSSSASPLTPSVFQAEPTGAVGRWGEGRKSVQLGPSGWAQPQRAVRLRVSTGGGGPGWAGPAAIPGQGQHQPPSSMIIWPPGSTWPIPTTFTPSNRRPSPWGWGKLTDYVGVPLRTFARCSSPAQALCSLPGWEQQQQQPEELKPIDPQDVRGTLRDYYRVLV